MQMLNCIRVYRTVAAAAVLVGLLPTLGSAQTFTERPLSDFIDQQGTYCLEGDTGCVLFVPPVASYLGWASAKNQDCSLDDEETLDCQFKNFALIDYAGVANDWLKDERGIDLGTRFSGKITERTLQDGTAEVSVTLHTDNALSWAIACAPAPAGCDFAGAATVFGHRAQELDSSEAAALGSVQFHLVFRMPAPGQQLPDLIQLFNGLLPGAKVRRISFQAHATAEDCSGRAGGMTVSQTGNFFTHRTPLNIQASIITFGPKASACE